ncbi:MAG: hypothetical protein ACRENE_18040, partial [Polyangiaceae bacterium]
MRASPRRLWAAGLVGLCLLVIPAAARAQDQAAPSAADSQRSNAPQIQPPTLQKDPGAVYPKQAIDDGITDVVEVPLTLDIDTEG